MVIFNSKLLVYQRVVFIDSSRENLDMFWKISMKAMQRTPPIISPVWDAMDSVAAPKMPDRELRMIPCIIGRGWMWVVTFNPARLVITLPPEKNDVDMESPFLPIRKIELRMVRCQYPC